MNPNEKIIKRLDKKRFDALAGLSRSPASEYISTELEWFANAEETILGVVVLDVTDSDFAAIALTRDLAGRYRAFDLECSIGTIDEAITWIHRKIEWHTGAGIRRFRQGDEIEAPDMFKPVLPPERLHPYFRHLSGEPTFTPARSIIVEMMPHFKDIDGNFVEQFQSTGFDSRLWELYLFAFLSEGNLFLDRTFNAPDFLVTKYGKSVAIEAVVVGRRKDNPPKYFATIPEFEPRREDETVLDQEMPIRFGSPLFSKLQKKYWELPHVKSLPLVFAIADFHDDQSMLWTSTSLINYLYGVRHEFSYDDSGKMIISPKKIDSHKFGDKEIPSGFFFQPLAENVSAVLFSASGTISKFNRIGRQAGFKAPNVTMIRRGTCHDHDPNATVPKMFQYIVDESCEETWAEGVSMFHNPHALHPVPEALFPNIAHHHYSDGQIVSCLPEFHPYGSLTINIRFRSDKIE